MFRRKPKKDIQLVSIAQRNGEAAVQEKYAPKTSSEVKAKRRAVRSMSFQHRFRRHEPAETKQEKQDKRKTSQPDMFKGMPKKETFSTTSRPLNLPDARLKLVTAPEGEDTKNAAVHTSNYSLKIFPYQGGQSSQNGRLKYRHSTYVSSGSYAPAISKKPSKNKEREGIEEEEDVQVLHFDDIGSSLSSRKASMGRPLSTYDPRERTGTQTSTFDVSYEL